jgi:hypothetical protein
VHKALHNTIKCIVPCKRTKKRCTRPYTTQSKLGYRTTPSYPLVPIPYKLQPVLKLSILWLGRPSHPLRGHCMPCFHIPSPSFFNWHGTMWSTWHLKPKTKLLMDPTKKLEKNSIYALLDPIKTPKKFVYGLYYMRCIRVKHTYIIRQ